MAKPSPDLADQIIERLNELCQKEPVLSALGRLLDKRVEVPAGTFALADEHGAVGLLHVLNEIVGVDEKGHGLIACVLTDESGHLTGFRRYKAPTDLVGVGPAHAADEEPTKAETPAARKSTPPSK
jgi:hypothetical protein